MSNEPKGTDKLQSEIAKEFRNLKSRPGLEIGLRPELGTFELCEKHYDASRTESEEHCAVCKLEAELAPLEGRAVIDHLKYQAYLEHEARFLKAELEKENRQQWISVSDRLPLHIESVYIWPRPDFGNEVHTGMYTSTAENSDMRWYACSYEPGWGSVEHEVKVTHWMPIPPPPEPKP